MNDTSGKQPPVIQKQQTKPLGAPHPPLSWDKKLVFSSSHDPEKKGELLWSIDPIPGGVGRKV